MLVDLTPEEVKYLLDGMAIQSAKLKRETPRRTREEGLQFLQPAVEQMNTHNAILRKLEVASGLEPTPGLVADE